jgi:hypothetical protein
LLSSLALLLPMEAAICMRLTVKLCMCRGTYCFMTPETVMLESEGGVQDDIRALAATMFHLMTGTDVHDVLDAQYKLLPEAVKERLEARCRKISTACCWRPPSSRRRSPSCRCAVLSV